MRGRKFYWHQKSPQGAVWQYHRFNRDAHREIADQCPPKLLALAPKTEFTCEIQFENLTNVELGALLYALEGNGPSHGLKLGKAKPRGLGSVRVAVEKLELLNFADRYKSLTGASGFIVQESKAYREGFMKWVAEKTSQPQPDFLRDFDKLHTLPVSPRVCAYPVNFKQYGWLPEENQGSGLPRDKRPEAMKRARDIHFT